MEKRLLIAVVLSIVVMLGYSQVIEKVYGKRQVRPFPSHQPAVTTQAPQPISPQIEAQTIRVSEKLNENIETIETEKFILTFSDIGGALKGIQIKEYKDAESGKPVKLVDIAEPQDGIFNLQSKIETSLPLIRYSSTRSDSKLIYAARLDNGLEIQKIYTIRNSNDDIELEIKFSNGATAPLSFAYNIIGPSAIEPYGKFDGHNVEADESSSGEVTRIPIGKIAKKPVRLQGKTDWVALKNNYFCIAIKPYETTTSLEFNSLKNNKIQSLIESGIVTLNKGTAASHKYLLYAGAAEIDKLGSYNLGFEKIIHYGFFDWIGKPLLLGLKFIHRFVRNWGLAIILLTLLTSLMLFPLTLKSLHSMKEMQALQPKIEALRKELKDSPQKLNKEIMVLYKKHKVNPFGGCLPMVLQMPIFIALYQVLIKSVELMGSKFLWIHDLAGTDKAFRLPAKLPLVGEWINILPVAAIGVMFLQQKMSQGSKAAMDETQRMMAIIMPIMFGFIFYNFPSGFLLYFLTSSGFTIAYQLKVKFFEKAEPCVDVRHK